MCVERRIRPKYLKPTANLVAFFGALLRVPHVGFFGISEFRVPIQFSKTDIISQASGISSVYAMCFVCVCFCTRCSAAIFDTYAYGWLYANDILFINIAHVKLEI